MHLFSIDGGLLFWTLATFGVLLFLLARFAFTPLQKLLAERERTIQEALEKAEQARRGAETLLTANQQRLEESRNEARRIIGEGQKIVTAMRREAEEQAKRQAESIIGEARAEIDREVRNSLSGLKATVAGLSIQIARQVVKDGLEEKRHRQLADEFIERLKQTHARP